MRSGPVWLFLLLALASSSHAAAIGDPRKLSAFEIDAGDASITLNAFSVQSGLQMLFNYDVMRGIPTKRISGVLKPFDALDEMIAGTEIQYEFLNRRTITLTKRLYLETRTPFIYAANGMYYSCVTFSMVDAMLLTRTQTLIWNVGVGLGVIPPNQLFCVVEGKLTPEDEEWRSADVEVIIRRARQPSWGPRH